mmetsp:Transcript_5087/g.13585  ORF Transcript_5087/g.13585 Transcript_5087/m.13585 type:complete len:397 (+) Transcript_5087:733-1923(+)
MEREEGSFWRWCADDRPGRQDARQPGRWSGLPRNQACHQRHAREEVALIWTLIHHVGDLRGDVEESSRVDEVVDGQLLQAREHRSLSRGVAAAHHGKAIRVHGDPVDLDERESLPAVLIVKVGRVQEQTELAVCCCLRVAVEGLQCGPGLAAGVHALQRGVHGALLPGDEAPRRGGGVARSAIGIELLHGGVKPAGVDAVGPRLLVPPVVLPGGERIGGIGVVLRLPGAAALERPCRGGGHRGVVGLPGALGAAGGGLVEEGRVHGVARVGVLERGLPAVHVVVRRPPVVPLVVVRGLALREGVEEARIVPLVAPQSKCLGPRGLRPRDGRRADSTEREHSSKPAQRHCARQNHGAGGCRRGGHHTESGKVVGARVPRSQDLVAHGLRYRVAQPDL